MSKPSAISHPYISVFPYLRRPEPGVVLVVGQAVLKHTRALVQPQGQQACKVFRQARAAARLERMVLL